MINKVLNRGVTCGSCHLIYNFRHSSVFICAALALIMGVGCSNAGQEANANSSAKTDTNASSQGKPPASEFTTEGKPTKTIETPWGTREIYDPRQDETFLDAVYEVYENENVTFGDLSRNLGLSTVAPKKLNLLENYVRNARRVHYYDLMRLGCKSIFEFPCDDYGSEWFTQFCPDSISQLGSVNFSKCERENLHTSAEIISQQFVTVEENQKKVKIRDLSSFRAHGMDVSKVTLGYYKSKRVCTMEGKTYDVQHVYYIGKYSDYTLDKTKKLLSYASCAQWHQNWQ